VQQPFNNDPRIERPDVNGMSSLASQLLSLRKQHDAALKAYDFQRADLIHQQIQQLQGQISTDHRLADRTQAELDLDHHHELITAKSANDGQTLTTIRHQITSDFHSRRQTIEQLFTQDYDALHAQHLLDIERETSRGIPEVDALLFQSRVFGKEHKYAQARSLHEQAMKLRNSINEERRRAVVVVFAKNERKLRNRKERSLKHIDEREKVALEEIERKHSTAHNIARNRLRVKDMKAERTLKDVERPERTESSFSAVHAVTATPRRTRSVSTLNQTRNSRKRSWEIAMEAQ
jgi:hypothetical protein